MNVADLMTEDPFVVTESCSLLVVEERMKLARVRHMPVTRGDRLVGLLSHRDLLSHSISCIADLDADERKTLLDSIPVGEVMVRDVITVRPETPLEQACQTMLERKVGCLPVVDEDAQIVGILTESDFVKLTRTLLRAVVGATKAAGPNGRIAPDG